MRLHLVSSRNGEVVGFTNSADAAWTATGKFAPRGLPTLGLAFRETNDADGTTKTFPMVTIELTPEQVKALRIKA